MNRTQIRSPQYAYCLTLLCISLLANAPPIVEAATIYDVAADWSDTSNPNGPWSYNGIDGLPLPVHRADWDFPTTIEHFRSAQPAWSAEDLRRSVPMAFKSLGDTTPTIWNLDAPAGKVGMHGQPPFAGITWTSPIDGIAAISGDVWKMRNNIGRTIEWRLELNGTLLTGGVLTEANPYTSAHPFFSKTVLAAPPR